MPTVFDYQLYRDIVETSFTERKVLTGGEPLLMKLSYKYHQARVCFLTLKAFIFLKIFYSEIVQLQYKNRRQGGLSGKYQWLRLAEIAAFVKKFRPGSVCEFGAGTSSALFARLIGADFVTHEESPYWRERLLDAAQGLAHKFNVILADRVVEQKDGEAVTCYNFAHDKYYDLVYVDGPQSTPPEGAENLVIKDPWNGLPNIDVELFWQNNIFPKIIVVDGRRPTVRRLIEKCQDRYLVHLKTDFYMNMNIPHFAEYRYHTVFVRKD